MLNHSQLTSLAQKQYYEANRAPYLRQKTCNAAQPAPQTTSIESATQLMSSIAESLSALRKEDLLSLLASVGLCQSVALRKQQVISKILELQAGVLDGTLDLRMQQADNVSEEYRAAERKKRLKYRLYSTSLSVWFIKPLPSTAGMREGSVNEHQILRSLPFFTDKRARG